MFKFKTLSLSLLCCCALAVIPVAWPARAQSNAIKVSVPFDFFIDGKVVPLGKYAISRSTSPGSQALRISSADGRFNRSFNTFRAESERPKPMQVVFNVYGNQHFLAQVFWPASVNGFQVSKCAAELALEEAARRDKSAPQFKRVVVSQ